uniref:receptor-like protein 12 n=1 Tax=Fragaria vesca subsp. vesca TaxID=101020 RepID=UPI0005CB2CA9|nr:PREDICTED: receptor-like protein 12 [Fragaria vesca subsp. vesca]
MGRIMGATLLVWFLIIATTSVSLCNGNPGVACKESERLALLMLKQDLTDPSNRLSSWAGESDCCQWTGVVCDNLTGNVRELQLDDPHFNSSLGGKVNPSLLNLTHLTYLNLSYNNFQTEIPSFFGSLESLTHLDLSQATFVGLIPHELGNLSSLRDLRLSSNYMLKVDNLLWISGLSQLEHLDMSFLDLSKASDHWLPAIQMLPSLVELHMSDCSLQYIPLLPIINLTSLAILDLSYNLFNSFMPGWVFSFRTLVSLILSGCGFQGPIPSSSTPHNITSLREISLFANQLTNPIPEWLLNNKDLTLLDLGLNLFSGPIPGGIANMTSLKVLHLEVNSFTSTIPEWLYSFHNLESLYIYSNHLHGEISSSIGNLTSIIYLELGYNQFEGTIPNSLGNLSSLESLDFSANQLHGTLPKTIGQLKRLTDLDISSNSFEGVVTEAHFTHLTSLKSFRAVGNSMTLKTSRDWLPPFQLGSMWLDHWRLGLELPLWLRTQTQLQSLSLSGTGISGTIPTWFWNISSHLSYLNLADNQLHGEIQYISSGSASVIDLSSNQFNGSLPLVSSNVVRLDLSNSSFSGSVIHFFCDAKTGPKLLTFLHLGNNYLSGNIPDCWMNWLYLEAISLENNNLTGNIPSSMGYLRGLAVLHLRNNQFSGELPQYLQNCTRLVVVDLSENQLSGVLPMWIGKSSSNLVVLSFRSNMFQGVISDQLCNLSRLQILDFADNDLSGTIPRCFGNFSGIANLSMLSASRRYFDNYGVYGENTFLVTKGRVEEFGKILGFVASIDLSSNNLSGEIPEELTNLFSLQTLNISANHLTGRIPPMIGRLKQLESLDFSRNQLSGEIPPSIMFLTFLSHLNLSHNNLTGQIPQSTQLQSLDESSFLGNELCGSPLSKNCSASKVTPPTIERERGYDLLDDKWFYLSLGLGFAVGFWSILGSLLVNMPWSFAFSRFLNSIVLKLYAVIVEYV